MGAARELTPRHARRELRWGWFDDARRATWELYRRHGWGPLVYGPLPGRRVSGCEQTALVVAILSGRDRLAAEQACAGIVAGLDEIDAERAVGVALLSVSLPAQR